MSHSEQSLKDKSRLETQEFCYTCQGGSGGGKVGGSTLNLLLYSVHGRMTRFKRVASKRVKDIIECFMLTIYFILLTMSRYGTHNMSVASD